MSTRGVWSFVAVLGLALVTGSCSPAPRHKLSAEEKTADLYWLFSQFNENYAPLDLKQESFGFKFDEMKKKALEAAPLTQSNEEFYLLMHKFVSEFRDAHTSSNILDSDLPGRAQTAYLGFSGKRSGDQFVVKSLLPTVKQDDKFPIKIGDKITKLDGRPLREIILSESVKYRNLGQDESNVTHHMNGLFNRSASVNGLPTDPNARITLLKDDKEVEITLPWIIKDLATFTAEQAAAAKKDEDKKDASGKKAVWEISPDVIAKILSGEFDLLPPELKRIRPGIAGYRFWDGFRFVDTSMRWDAALLAADDPADPLARLKDARSVPDNAILLPKAKTFPTYFRLEHKLDADGKPVGAGKYIAYMYLDTFSPAGEESAVVDEFNEALETLQANGVNDLVIDLIDNGGGSLSLGMRLAQALSPEKVVMPTMKMRINEQWVDEFQQQSLDTSASDAVREIGRRVYTALLEDEPKGRLSRPWSAETLLPYPLLPHTDLTQKFHVVLLVNEMCASMCDIFTAIMKDNGLVTVLGSRTMGAGGNVVTIQSQAPNSHLGLNQTESLVLRKDGTPVENHGIEPDVVLAVVDSVSSKYTPVREKAVKLLLEQ